MSEPDATDSARQIQDICSFFRDGYTSTAMKTICLVSLVLVVGQIRECQMDAVLHVRDVRPRRVVSAGQKGYVRSVEVVLPLPRNGGGTIQ